MEKMLALLEENVEVKDAPEAIDLAVKTGVLTFGTEFVCFVICCLSILNGVLFFLQKMCHSPTTKPPLSPTSHLKFQPDKPSRLWAARVGASPQ